MCLSLIVLLPIGFRTLPARKSKPVRGAHNNLHPNAPGRPRLGADDLDETNERREIELTIHEQVAFRCDRCSLHGQLAIAVCQYEGRANRAPHWWSWNCGNLPRSAEDPNIHWEHCDETGLCISGVHLPGESSQSPSKLIIKEPAESHSPPSDRHLQSLWISTSISRTKPSHILLLILISFAHATRNLDWRIAKIS